MSENLNWKDIEPKTKEAFLERGCAGFKVFFLVGKERVYLTHGKDVTSSWITPSSAFTGYVQKVFDPGYRSNIKFNFTGSPMRIDDLVQDALSLYSFDLCLPSD